MSNHLSDTRNYKKALAVNDVRAENSDSVYVLTKASKITKVTTNLLLPHKSQQNGDVRSIEIPMTFNPVDLSSFAPKDELVRNPELLRMVHNGILQLITAEEAEERLETPEGRAETERLTAERMRRFSGQQNDMMATNDIKTVYPKDKLEKASPGDFDGSLKGISPVVVDALTNPAVEESHRASLVRNLVDRMTDADKTWVRANTSDPQIRNIVA